MFETEIRVSFLSDWHIGSGLGDGAIADSILARDDNGLPFLPGRAVKGALREGAWRLGRCRPDLAFMVEYLWGTRSTAAVSNTPGKIMVGGGRLPDDLADWLLSRDPKTRRHCVEDMTLLRMQTALDEDKMVRDHTLRTTECGIPGLFFTSPVSIDAPRLPDAWLKVYFTAVCAAVKSMGADRARGLGHCLIRPKDAGDGPVELPAPFHTDVLHNTEDAQ